MVVASARRLALLHVLSLQARFMCFDLSGVRLPMAPHFLVKDQTLLFFPREIRLPKLIKALSGGGQALLLGLGA